MPRFTSFVLFAEMRTGSNHLEESLAAIDGITTFGEAFNPAFVGGPKVESLLGFTTQSRDENPLAVLKAIQNEPGMSGFRYFHNHDPRVCDAILSDQTCAKVILTRNPLDAYVSLRIAEQTNQWRLTNAKMAKHAQVSFNGADFDARLEALQAFQSEVHRALQATGQTAFYMNYEDISSLVVINGLAQFLGVEGRLDELPGRIKRQNPGRTVDKVSNPDEMQAHLESLDPFALARTPNFEPPRGAAVPLIQAAAKSPLMHLPVPGGPLPEIEGWLSRLDDTPIVTGFSQKSLRPWMREKGNHITFSVIRHPLARAHHVFCSCVLPKNVEGFTILRRKLIGQYGVPVPPSGVDDTYDRDAHYTAFLGYLGFLKSILNGSTALRVNSYLASQLSVIQGISSEVPPQRIIRETDVDGALVVLAKDVGARPVDALPSADDEPYTLAEIYDQSLEAAAFEAYRKDYLTFGFETWKPVL